MNVSYRIVKVDPSDHGVVVRYFTDKVTEDDLATSFNTDGSIKRNADGYPLSTRTDMFISIFDTPAPSFDQIDKMIMLRAPVDWLKVQESVNDKNIDTSLKSLSYHVGDTKKFTDDDIITLRTEDQAAAQANLSVNVTENQPMTNLAILTGVDVIKDKKPFLEFANSLIIEINAGHTIPLNIK